MKAYDWMMRHLHCIGCGCFIPLAAVTAVTAVGGYVTWQVV